jgi:uncharacterized protein
MAMTNPSTASEVPVPAQEREHFMDALRGLAILGIFIINLIGLSQYNPGELHPGGYYSSFDESMLFLQHWFIEGKFYSIFSLLFGWGLALQMKRAQGSEERLVVSPLIRRRLLFMFLLGFVHLAFVWNGDIVAFYALVAWLLILFIQQSPKRLLQLGISCILLPILLYWLKMNYPVLKAPSDFLFSIMDRMDQYFFGFSGPDAVQQFQALYRQGNIGDFLLLNFDGLFYRLGDLVFQSRIFKVLGMFMIGFAIGKTGYFNQLMKNPEILWWIAGVGFVVGLPFNYLLAVTMSELRGTYESLKPEGLLRTVVYALGVVPLSLAYVASLALFFRTAIGHKLLMRVAPVGRMAFTNYISHSVISVFIFWGVGLGYMGMLGPVAWTVFALLVYGAQIVFSTLWLQRFEYGPLEWIWRSLTYGKPQPLLKKVIN